MGIFSTSTGYFSGLSMDMDNVVPALESANYTAMSLHAVAEAEANYNIIMKAIGVHELAAYEETGSEVVYESGAISGFIAKIKQFFVKLWDKIKEIFHKFFVWLDSLTKDNKEFAKKYEAEARKRWNSLKDEFKVKGYKFKNLEGVVNKYKAAESAAQQAYSTAVGAAVPHLTEDIISRMKAGSGTWDKAADDKLNKNFSDKHDDAIEAVRGAIKAGLVGGADSGLTSEEFTKELFEGFRDGDSSPITLEKSDINLDESISELKNYSQAKKDADNAFKELKRSLDEAIKGCEKAEKAANKLGSDSNDVKYTDNSSASGNIASYVNHVLTAWKDIKEVLTTANGAYLQALKDRATQDKKIVAAVITTGKVKNESADYNYNESAGSMDFLAGVVLK